MNILIIDHYAGSPEMGMEFRPYYFACEWIKLGHTVNIVAGDFSHLRKKNPTVKKDFQREEINGILYHWIKTGYYHGNGLKRAVTMAKFVTKLWVYANKIIKEINPDVVICSSTYPLDTYVGQRIKRKSKKNVKLIHEVHDMWPATLIEVGGMSKYNPFVVAMQVGENSAYKHSDKVVSLPPLAKEYMVVHGMNPEKFIEIPNGIVVQDWGHPNELPCEHLKLLDNLKQKNKFIVGYFGGHALSNALGVLIDCAERIEDKQVHFVLVGDGVEKETLMCSARDRKLKNISFLDSICKKSVPELCKYIDAIYMGGHDSPLYRFGLCMNKMFDAFMAGKPIICAITTPESPISKFNCGIMVKSMDVDGVIRAINFIKNMDSNDLEKMKIRARNLAINEYSYEKLGKKFETTFVDNQEA